MALEYIAYDAWPLFLLSLMLSFAAFPLVVLCSFLYSHLSARHAEVPKILWMWLATFAGVLAGVFLFYAYLETSLSALVK
ncbi:hypothetical protein HZC09_04625 [Candidatus Micrarchaeota archaeon]|nr:hypothetical protein [Candidatus Micrarchaeota archaeon]